MKSTFKLGRGHEADLRINDISVSRCHSFIKFKHNKFLLEDNMSKFGTLVLVKDKVPIVPNYNKAMQVGRTVVNFSIKPINQSGKGQEADNKFPTEAAREDGSYANSNLAATSDL
jgi:pSer/pThr/pTyr-binding forkhead associated (FHA) protein